jgi:hypothetical protein
MNNEARICQYCGFISSADMFVGNTCKTCKHNYDKAWRKNHPEKMEEYKKKYGSGEWRNNYMREYYKKKKLTSSTAASSE